MFYVGRSESLAATVHLSGSGSMTLCGLLVPLRDHLGRAWWCQEFSTPSIADVLRRITIEEADLEPPCERCLCIGQAHPERLLTGKALSGSPA